MYPAPHAHVPEASRHSPRPAHGEAASRYEGGGKGQARGSGSPPQSAGQAPACAHESPAHCSPTSHAPLPHVPVRCTETEDGTIDPPVHRPDIVIDEELIQLVSAAFEAPSNEIWGLPGAGAAAVCMAARAGASTAMRTESSWEAELPHVIEGTVAPVCVPSVPHDADSQSRRYPPATPAALTAALAPAPTVAFHAPSVKDSKGSRCAQSSAYASEAPVMPTAMEAGHALAPLHIPQSSSALVLAPPPSTADRQHKPDADCKGLKVQS